MPVDKECTKYTISIIPTSLKQTVVTPPISPALIPNIILIAGELDPERMGSGIQYGDASLRRLNRQQAQQSRRPDCSCWVPDSATVLTVYIQHRGRVTVRQWMATDVWDICPSSMFIPAASSKSVIILANVYIRPLQPLLIWVLATSKFSLRNNSHTKPAISESFVMFDPLGAQCGYRLLYISP